jgi:hypothetical protein
MEGTGGSEGEVSARVSVGSVKIGIVDFTAINGFPKNMRLAGVGAFDPIDSAVGRILQKNRVTEPVIPANDAQILDSHLPDSILGPDDGIQGGVESLVCCNSAKSPVWNEPAPSTTMDFESF